MQEFWHKKCYSNLRNYSCFFMIKGYTLIPFPRHFLFGTVMVFLFVTATTHLHAQQTYVPFDTLTKYKKDIFLRHFKERYTAYIDRHARRFKGKQRSYLKKYLKAYFEHAHKEFSHNELYFNKEGNQFLNELYAGLRRNNPQLRNTKVYLYLSRHVTPNAYSVGEGTIAVHLDLLRYLENENQLAAVLSHELSHYLLDHLGKSYGEYVRYLTSPEYKQKVKEVFHDRYGRGERAEAMLKNILYSRKRKSRKQEMEADSLGLLLYLNAGYPAPDYIRVMHILDSVDTEKDSLRRDFLRRWFNTPSQPFDEEWLYLEDFTAYHYRKDKDEDSLKSHPDMKLRAERLEKMLREINNQKSSSSPKIHPYFNELKKRAGYEKVFNLYYRREYGQALYDILKNLQKQPDDPFFLKMFVLTFDKLTDAKKNFALSRYVPPYNPRKHTDSQRLFINFLNNMEYEQMENILHDYEHILKQKHISKKIFAK